MNTLKEKKNVKKPLSEEEKKERMAKARATRHRHIMETLYLEYQVNLSMEEKTMWEKKQDEEKEETVLQWDRLKNKSEKGNKASAPTFAMAKGGEGTSDN
jgi:hypothetical protein